MRSAAPPRARRARQARSNAALRNARAGRLASPRLHSDPPPRLTNARPAYLVLPRLGDNNRQNPNTRARAAAPLHTPADNTHTPKRAARRDLTRAPARRRQSPDEKLVNAHTYNCWRQDWEPMGACPSGSRVGAGHRKLPCLGRIIETPSSGFC